MEMVSALQKAHVGVQEASREGKPQLHRRVPRVPGAGRLPDPRAVPGGVAAGLLPREARGHPSPRQAPLLLPSPGKSWAPGRSQPSGAIFTGMVSVGLAVYSGRAMQRMVWKGAVKWVGCGFPGWFRR